MSTIFGTVKSFDRRKGDGLITPEDGGADVYVHVSVVERAGLANLEIGDRVSFDMMKNEARAQSVATNLRLL